MLWLLLFYFSVNAQLSPGQSSEWTVLAPAKPSTPEISYRWSRPAVNTCTVEFRAKTDKILDAKADISYLAHQSQRQATSSATNIVHLPGPSEVHLSPCERIVKASVTGVKAE